MQHSHLHAHLIYWREARKKPVIHWSGMTIYHTLSEDSANSKLVLFHAAILPSLVVVSLMLLANTILLALLISNGGPD